MHSPPTHMISQPDHISAHSGGLLDAPAIGVDTEFVRERTFFPRPGLLQFSDGRQVWLLDPVTLAGEPGLKRLLAGIMCNDSATKILHSTGEDLEIIELVGKSRPAPLFDTQRAAALLGWPLQVRYEVLAGELLGVEFPGGLARNDWCRRPLPAAWLEYAANDVIALPRMREVLQERLERAGRLDWLIEDCRRIVARQQNDNDPVVRIKGAARLSDPELERLSRLARWREEQARKRDLPRGFIAGDPVLLALARGGPNTDPDRLSAGKGRLGKRDRDRLIELIEAPAGDYRRPPELAVLTGEQRARISELQGRIRHVSEQLGVEPTVIASKRDLTRLVQGAPCDWFDGWRGELLDLS